MKKIIVTICDAKKRFSGYDIEIPSDVPIGQLKKDIVETLNSYKASLSLSEAGVVLSSKRMDRNFKDDETPQSAGIWNGDYIYLNN